MMVFHFNLLLLVISITLFPLCLCSSLSSYILSFISSSVSSYIRLIATLHSFLLKADWHAIHRAALCTNDNDIFNGGVLLVDTVMSGTCVMGTSGTRRMYSSSHCSHLLITPSCYANISFNICLCIILNTYFLTDCTSDTYYFAITFTILLSSDKYPFSFYSPTGLSQARRGDGVIQDSHQGLILWDWTEWPSTMIRFS